VLAKDLLRQRQDVFRTLERKDYEAQQQLINKVAIDLQSLDNVEFLDLSPAYCSIDQCTLQKDDLVYFRDEDHLSDEGALKSVPLLTYFLSTPN